MKRRHFLAGAGVAGLAGVLAVRPSDRGAPYNEYFARLNQLLRTEGAGYPQLLLDLDVLDANIQRLTQLIRSGVDYRIVVKSLPCPRLVEYVMDKAKTTKLMVFHQPFLSQIAAHMPKADVLLGKPLPVAAADRFYQDFSGQSGFNPTRQLQWLIDSQARLESYLQLARQYQQKLRINIELDVGLHRGGLNKPEQLDALLDTIVANPAHLEFSGFMGYDPHVVKLPRIIKSREQAFAQSQQQYQRFITRLQKRYPQLTTQPLCFNGAGSPTLALHQQDSVLTEVAAGSCLVKPSDFDLDTLSGFTPAAFIASPVLKVQDGVQVPGIEWASGLFGNWDANQQQSLFVYGGNWLAKPYAPQGLQANPLYGVSSNQQMLNGSKAISLAVGDQVFWRPTQSEALFLQFGDILPFRNGQLIASWPVLQG